MSAFQEGESQQSIESFSQLDNSSLFFQNHFSIPLIPHEVHGLRGHRRGGDMDSIASSQMSQNQASLLTQEFEDYKSQSEYYFSQEFRGGSNFTKL